MRPRVQSASTPSPPGKGKEVEPTRTEMDIEEPVVTWESPPTVVNPRNFAAKEEARTKEEEAG